MRVADEKKFASGTLAEQEAEKAAGDSHHSNTVDLTGDFDIGDFDFSNDIIILDDAPGQRALIHHIQRVLSRLRNLTSLRADARPLRVNSMTKPRPPPIKASKPSVVFSWTCPTWILIGRLSYLQCGRLTHAQ
jgi:hypothetical protein